MFFNIIEKSSSSLLATALESLQSSIESENGSILEIVYSMGNLSAGDCFSALVWYSADNKLSNP